MSKRQGEWVSPVHHSESNGVHVDVHHPDGTKDHAPFSGQTTLDTYTRPSYENDRRLADLGGSIRNE